ncbi:MAG: DUF971 domain-containing protein [Phycisphaerae bacterium]
MRPAPQGIKYKRESRELEITWSPGDVVVYTAYDLRCECACAACVDERTGMRILDLATVPRDTGIEKMELVGNYAIQFLFTDTHDTGIYSWDRLDILRRG